ncbi:MAG TPA: methionine--tRNA ligase [Ktedonobacter sp.]|jgi:methionyl-tRNA synthetase|nr:methionine--tRNA ligase [Ktedonobacter sp.]HAG98013.1 methionine--tRNA ligase [Ktedonobacter sp.]HBE24368.1 methionine--tRNA ligase [Ktedonobacter sp.]HBE27792.1 methionine--tRNA ligase [Ktedonobacter sp.]HCF84657.1 methionine--tRNA ligase [Ktedonobacter sp.]
MNEHILVCVAWPYAKSSTHVGQIVGAYLPADTFARYHRLAGNKVLMVSGSDEHGTPILVDAEREGISPREFVARYHRQICEIWDRLGISWDLYTETGTENHYRITQDFFLTLYDKGYIFKNTMQSPYCPTDGRFLPDRYIEGTCPNCGYSAARGDQCDNCGHTLDPIDLINPRCRLCGSKDSALEIRPTDHFFLDLPKLQESLLAWLSEGKQHWRANTLDFAMSWLKEGLRARAITRDLDWGVPIPLEGYEDKRIYVWFDAVIGYFSASVEWAERQGTPEAWKTWWVPGQSDPAVKSYYFIGKDNIPFHAIIWPAMLQGYGNRNLPYDVPANEFMTMSGAKASSSRGNVIWTRDVLDQYSADALRYYLSATAPEGRDTDFTFDELIRRNNDELVAAYGNAVHRTLTFLQSKFGGVVPQPQALREADREILAEIDRGFSMVGHNIANCHFKDGLNAAMGVARAANRYLDEQAPWKQIKVDREAAGTTLYVMLQVISGLRVMFCPYLPFSSQKLHHLLGFEGDVSAGSWRSSEVPAGKTLPIPTPLFPKLEELARV